jgi:hypothetical protein
LQNFTHIQKFLFVTMRIYLSRIFPLPPSLSEATRALRLGVFHILLHSHKYPYLGYYPSSAVTPLFWNWLSDERLLAVKGERRMVGGVERGIVAHECLTIKFPPVALALPKRTQYKKCRDPDFFSYRVDSLIRHYLV